MSNISSTSSQQMLRRCYADVALNTKFLVIVLYCYCFLFCFVCLRIDVFIKILLQILSQIGWEQVINIRLNLTITHLQRKCIFNQKTSRNNLQNSNLFYTFAGKSTNHCLICFFVYNTPQTHNARLPEPHIRPCTRTHTGRCGPRV